MPPSSKRISIDRDKEGFEADGAGTSEGGVVWPAADDGVLEEEEALLEEIDPRGGRPSKEDRRPSATEPAPAVMKERLIIPPYVMIPVWICLSGGVIVMNKHIFSNMGFPYPVFITCYHMVVATIGTRLMRFIPGRLSETKINVSSGVYTRTILPLALLFSASLILSNVAYVHLSVSFVQMLKAWIPIFVLVIQLVIGVYRYNHLLLCIIAITSFGCSVAASGEIKFSAFGFACQVAAVVVESCRLVLIQILLKDYAMSPLQSVALYAPLCAIAIGISIPVMEGLAPFRHIGNVGAPMLIANGIVAFSLNIAGVFLIDSAGSLVLTLSGIVKDILLILSAVLFMGAVVTGNQIIGYSIAIIGLTLFRLTGGDPRSHYGKMVSGYANWLFPEDASMKRQLRMKMFALPSATIVLLGILSYYGAQHVVTPYFTQTTDTALLRAVRYSPHSESVRHLGENEWRGHFTQYVQDGSAREMIPSFDPIVNVRKLPRLAWVVVATPDAIKEYGQELTSLSCYCERAGIPFFLEHSVMVENRHFMTARHRSVARHLRYHQWVIATDADMIVANSLRDPREFLDDAVDVMFNDRDNREVCACVYFVRNSPGGWSFLRRWMSWDDHGERLNNDNGDLNELVAAGLTRGLPNNADYTGRYAKDEDVPSDATSAGGEPCINAANDWEGYNADFITCLDHRVHSLRYDDDTKPYWDVTLWEWTSILPPVRFRSFKVFSGFVRMMEGTAELQWAPFHANGIYNDFLVTGKKLYNFLTPTALFCTGEEWRYPHSQWGIDEARATMIERRFWWWPGCWENGINRCREMVQVK